MLKLVSKAALAFATVSAEDPGLGFSLTQTGLNEAKNEITPILFANLKNLTLPEIDFDGGYLKNMVVNIPQPDVSTINLNLLQATNGGELTATGIKATMEGDFKFKEVITVTGGIDIIIKKLNIDFEMDFSE